jgi:hypothetical protein
MAVGSLDVANKKGTTSGGPRLNSKLRDFSKKVAKKAKKAAKKAKKKIAKIRRKKMA